VWLNIYYNFSKILDLGYKGEASTYVLLALTTLVYAAFVAVIVLVSYYHNRHIILDLEPTDFVTLTIFGLFYLVVSTVYVVTDKFTSLGLFYIDEGGFWIFRCYVVFYPIFGTSQLAVVCAAKLKRFPSDLNRWDSQGLMDERVFVH
jgi:hypothetical protein